MRNVLQKLSFILFVLVEAACSPNEEPVATQQFDKVLILGNSITLHPAEPGIGWYGNWGMAASAPELDFVSLLSEELRKDNPDLELRIEHMFPFEVFFETFDFAALQPLKDWKPDLIVVRFGENIASERVRNNNLGLALKKLIEGLDNGHNPKVIVSTTFWPNPGVNETLKTFAQTSGYPLVELTDLSAQGSNMALKLFANEAVASHPNDQGMKQIAMRLYSIIKQQ
jgi:hypothetical protein